MTGGVDPGSPASSGAIGTSSMTSSAGNVPAVPVPNAKRAYRRRLTTTKHVRTALADVVRTLEDGSLDPHRGRALIYGLATLAQIINGGLVEDRIGALERRIGVGS